jgi:glycosyltransferase involved in cell wall biosynthesis
MSQIPVDQALVSIVLPTYSRAHLLGYAIRSVLGQTYGNLELIIVDDNSNDETPDVVRSFNDARIRYVRNEANLKLPRALNKGFELARGGFLTWTSDDNLYASNAIEKMVAVLRRGACDFVFADYFLFSDLDLTNGKPTDVQRVRLPAVPRLEEMNTVGACFLYTRAVFEAVGLYDPELFLVEDYDYFMRIQKRFKIGHIAEPLYYFSRHDESLFCSRFAEVKAADVLARYKNGLLDKQKATDACVGLVMRDPGALTNPLLRKAYPVIKRTSFRLTEAYERFVRAYLRHRITPRVQMLLEGFSSRAMTFSEAKDALHDVLQEVAKLEYK